MKILLRFVLPLVCALTVTLLIEQLGEYLTGLAQRGARVAWLRAPQLPDSQAVQQFLALKQADLYVKTNQGRLFVLRPAYAPESINWKEVQTLPDAEDSWGTCRAVQFPAAYWIANPPGYSMQQRDCTQLLPTTLTRCDSRYLLVANGDVWNWTLCNDPLVNRLIHVGVLLISISIGTILFLFMLSIGLKPLGQEVEVKF